MLGYTHRSGCYLADSFIDVYAEKTSRQKADGSCKGEEETLHTLLRTDAAAFTDCLASKNSDKYSRIWLRKLQNDRCVVTIFFFDCIWCVECDDSYDAYFKHYPLFYC